MLGGLQQHSEISSASRKPDIMCCRLAVLHAVLGRQERAGSSLKRSHPAAECPLLHCRTTAFWGCLREQYEDLGAACKEEVFKRQAEAANDWRTDKELNEACQVHKPQLKLHITRNSKEGTSIA